MTRNRNSRIASVPHLLPFHFTPINRNTNSIRRQSRRPSLAQALGFQPPPPQSQQPPEVYPLVSQSISSSTYPTRSSTEITAVTRMEYYLTFSITPNTTPPAPAPATPQSFTTRNYPVTLPQQRTQHYNSPNPLLG